MTVVQLVNSAASLADQCKLGQLGLGQALLKLQSQTEQTAKSEARKNGNKGPAKWLDSYVQLRATANKTFWNMYRK